MPNNPYSNVLDSEGILRWYLAQLTAQDAASKAEMDAAIAGLQGDYNGSGNPFSQVAQMQRALKERRGGMRANRAARGVIQSGGTALAEGDIGYNYGLQQYQAARALSQQIAGLQSQYAQGSRDRFGQIPGLYEDAIGRLQQAKFRPGPVRPPGPAPYGYYRDKLGRLTPKGKPYKKNLIFGGN